MSRGDDSRAPKGGFTFAGKESVNVTAAENQSLAAPPANYAASGVTGCVDGADLNTENRGHLTGIE